jgi:hypothetical protein
VSQQIPRVQMSPDNFLYACHSADVARTRKNGVFQSHLRYEPFLMGSYVRPSGPKAAQLRLEILAIAKHHFQISPQFRRNESIDLETISFFTLAISTFFADVERIFNEYCGLTLPKIPAHDTEYSDNLPQVGKVIALFSSYLKDNSPEKPQFDPFQSSDENSEDSLNAAEYGAEIWDVISEAVFQSFPEHAPALMSYASWKYKTEEKVEAVDWRIRPPVGELFAKAFRGRGPSRAGASANSPQRGGPDGRKGPGKGSKFDRKLHQQSSAEPALQDSDSTEVKVGSSSETEAQEPASRTQRGDRPHRERREDHDEHRVRDRQHREPRSERGAGPRHGSGRGDRGHRHGGREGKETLIQSDSDLEPFLKEARESIEKLKKNPGLEEVRLSPSNSFIRRHQHEMISQAGFATESRGEGRERTIYVLQNKH